MKSKKEIFLEATATTKWAAIKAVDEIINKLDRAGYWDKDFRDRALLNQKRKEVRRQIKTLKNEEGFPLFASIKITDENGDEKRVYKQETLFDLDDYQQTINYCVSTVNRGIRLADYYHKQAFRRFHVQIPLPFELPDQARRASKN